MMNPEAGSYMSKQEIQKEQKNIESEGREFHAVIPRGWTNLNHGTNLIKWGDINPFTSDTIKLSASLSTVSQEEFDWVQKNHGKQYNTTKTFSTMVKRPEEMSDSEFEKRNKPFEIRVVFYQNHPRSCADPEYKKGLDEKTMDEISEYYFANVQGGRHPLVPRGEVLIKLGHVQENGIDIFYFVPESVADAYSKESGIEIKKLKEAEEK